MTAIYSTGTITVTAGGMTASFSGAALLTAGVEAGATVEISGQAARARFASVNGETNVTFDLPWAGSSVANKAFKIYRDDAATTVGKAAAKTAELVAQLAGSKLAYISGGAPDDSLGDDGQFHLNAANWLLSLRSSGAWAAYGSVGVVPGGFFQKADWTSVAFTKTGASAVSIKAGAKIELNGVIYSFAAATAVQMPTLTAGTDYAIYICNDGTLRADASFSYPSGFSASTSRKIGGLHYAPGGNAAAQAGGDSTPAINPYSLWDLKFRPACLDQRGMALVAGAVWVDIYLLCRDHIVNGTSKFGAVIATNGAKPKIPLEFGGDGSAAYSACDWWAVSEILNSHGKRLMRYDEFCAAAYGVTEASAAGSHPIYAGLDYVRTSKWGIMQATGNIHIFGFGLREHWNGSDAAARNDTAGGRGQPYSYGSITAPLFGGYYGDSIYAGSRYVNLVSTITTAVSFVGARGCCAHVCHV